eukprot:TRINITY_DN872_c0_g1_i7.p2 TRINITY_DN872_c0_g1~~TRINITY_DN872_c0_g1_i7.p2  ORF type:complete len:507 (+),score=107.57 TRINITY_DN872_c0_g1_i7:401-1921(+)
MLPPHLRTTHPLFELPARLLAEAEDLLVVAASNSDPAPGRRKHTAVAQRLHQLCVEQAQQPLSTELRIDAHRNHDDGVPVVDQLQPSQNRQLPVDLDPEQPGLVRLSQPGGEDQRKVVDADARVAESINVDVLADVAHGGVVAAPQLTQCGQPATGDVAFCHPCLCQDTKNRQHQPRARATNSDLMATQHKRVREPSPRPLTSPSLCRSHAAPQKKRMALSQPSAELAARLYAALGLGPGANVVYSPLSVSICLQMAVAGASGTTRAELLAALALDEQSLAVASTEVAQLTEVSASLALANAVLHKPDFGTLLPPFAEVLRSVFKASVYRVERGLVAAVNSWVSEKTQGRIPNCLDSSAENATAVLVNAVYFKGAWAKAFPSESTRPGQFTCADGQAIQRQFMRKKEHLAAIENELGKVVQIPYKDGAVVAVAILPHAGVGTGGAAKHFGLLPSTFRALDEARKKEIDLQMPRFRAESAFSLSDAFRSLGVSAAFSGLNMCETVRL